MSVQEGNKCKHPNCTCQVKSGESYCSAQCEASAKTPDIDCKCAHAGCSGRIS